MINSDSGRGSTVALHTYSPLSELRRGLNVRLCCVSSDPIISETVSLRHWVVMLMSVSTLALTVTVHKRLKTVPLNELPTLSISIVGFGTAAEEQRVRYEILPSHNSL